MRAPSASVRPARLRGCHALAVLLAAPLLAACAPPVSLGAARPLSRLRHDQLPEHLPAAWRQQLDHAAARLPAMTLSDPGAVARVRDCLERVAWIDPRTIEVAPALPDGIRALYRPRTPRLAIARGDQPLALLSADGVVLPEGFSAAAMQHYLRVPLDRDVAAPEVGARVNDPLLQEALFAALEAVALRDRLGIPLARIERRFDFPISAIGVPPALSFLCEDGREICWGWSLQSEERISPPAEARVPLATKVARVQAAVERFPGLQGISRLVVDRPVCRAYDLEGKEIPDFSGL